MLFFGVLRHVLSCAEARGEQKRGGHVSSKHETPNLNLAVCNPGIRPRLILVEETTLRAEWASCASAGLAYKDDKEAF